MYFAIRRIFEFVISLCALILISPLLLIFSVLIKIDSKGPVIFKQERIGKNGKVFKMYKFRTMVTGAQNMGTGVYSFNGDPRITRIGKFLRKTSLDELPQLFNVLIGNMAIVGPRAPVYGHFPEYNALNDTYKKRFKVRPGITGLAQVVGRNELTWDEKVKYDNIYVDKVKKYTFLYDIMIIVKTFLRVFSMSNVNETQESLDLNKKQLENAISQGNSERETKEVCCETDKKEDENEK